MKREPPLSIKGDGIGCIDDTDASNGIGYIDDIDASDGE